MLYRAWITTRVLLRISADTRADPPKLTLEPQLWPTAPTLGQSQDVQVSNAHRATVQLLEVFETQRDSRG